MNPQNYSWEQLKAPLLVEDFAELHARLRLLPPASFRPRRAASDFHVCPLHSVDHAGFDPSTNSVVAVLHDRAGQQAMLIHPWSERGQTGAEALLSALRSEAKPLFVAGHIRRSGETLLIHPTAVVFATATGARSAVLPFLDHTASAQGSGLSAERPGTARATHSRYHVAEELASELLLSGLRRISTRQWPGWQRARTELEERGYHRLAAVMQEVQAAVEGEEPVLKMLKLLALARSVA
ncbi:MAG: hypothetical protein EOP86_16230 [Verrucomicrobiaceae bacterium]|nr:MAG: hypothetical protein EOP86_16230 [Verrucomicrobiaceae bacterium]